MRLYISSKLSFTRIPRSSWAPRWGLNHCHMLACLLMMHKTQRRLLSIKWALHTCEYFCFHTTLGAWKELKPTPPHVWLQRKLWHGQRIPKDDWCGLTLRWNLNNHKQHQTVKVRWGELSVSPRSGMERSSEGCSLLENTKSSIPGSEAHSIGSAPVPREPREGPLGWKQTWIPPVDK